MKKNTIKNIIIIILIMINIGLGYFSIAAVNHMQKIEDTYNATINDIVEYHNTFVVWSRDTIEQLGTELEEIGYTFMDNETTYMVCFINEETQRYVAIDYTDILE